MLHNSIIVLATLSLLTLGCFRPSNYSHLGNVPPSRHLKDAPIVHSGESLFIGAGDIASCNKNIPHKYSAHEKTAQLIETYPKDTPIFTLGDNVYPSGTTSEFQNCYNLAWGRFKNRTTPVTGNHDYRTKDAAGYFSYFGKQSRGKSYYSFDLEKWHVVVLDSECPGSIRGKCQATDPQLQWLENDLKNSQKQCTLALWHKPRFSTGLHGNHRHLSYLYERLVDHGVDVVATGHDHHYERFAPISKNLKVDHTKGIRQFVIGTGGAPLRGKNRSGDKSVFKTTNHHGVIEFHLKANSYAWRFIAVDGQVIDSGQGACH